MRDWTQLALVVMRLGVDPGDFNRMQIDNPETVTRRSCPKRVAGA
jgi:hypothetical protein